jgi:hypothetical protein
MKLMFFPMFLNFGSSSGAAFALFTNHATDLSSRAFLVACLSRSASSSLHLHWPCLPSLATYRHPSALVMQVSRQFHRLDAHQPADGENHVCVSADAGLPSREGRDLAFFGAEPPTSHL